MFDVLFHCSRYCVMVYIDIFSGAGRMCDGTAQEMQVNKYCGDKLGTFTMAQTENGIVCGNLQCHLICIIRFQWEETICSYYNFWDETWVKGYFEIHLTLYIYVVQELS